MKNQLTWKIDTNGRYTTTSEYGFYEFNPKHPREGVQFLHQPAFIRVQITTNVNAPALHFTDLKSFTAAAEAHHRALHEMAGRAAQTAQIKSPIPNFVLSMETAGGLILQQISTGKWAIHPYPHGSDGPWMRSYKDDFVDVSRKRDQGPITQSQGRHPHLVGGPAARAGPIPLVREQVVA